VSASSGSAAPSRATTRSLGRSAAASALADASASRPSRPPVGPSAPSGQGRSARSLWRVSLRRVGSWPRAEPPTGVVYFSTIGMGYFLTIVHICHRRRTDLDDGAATGPFGVHLDLTTPSVPAPTMPSGCA